MLEKSKYFLSSTKKMLFAQDMACPSCGYQGSNNVIDRKYFVTELRRCKKCQLLHRVPTTTEKENYSFYQSNYQEGIVSRVLSDEEIQDYISQNFSNLDERQYSNYLDVVKATGAKQGDKIFDFGCSWGYGSWQMKDYGLDVESYEISKPRADIAKHKLGLYLHDSLSSVRKECFDFFFSSHVLEHVPSVKNTIEFAFSILKPGGFFIAFTPNGSNEYRQLNPESWHKLWGLVHPNFLDVVFYDKCFANENVLITSSPYDLNSITDWRKSPSRVINRLVGQELLVIAQKT